METYSIVLDILILIVCAKILGELFDKLALPRVIGEVLAGIILGPSILCLIIPSSEMHVLALIGVLFFMTSAGLEVDLRRLIAHFKEGLVVALMGVVTPFSLGMLIGFLYGLNFIQAYALATCLSITAIGLSIRVFMDLRMLKSRAALTVINAAVIDDIIGLILMSIAFSLAREEEITLHTATSALFSCVVFIALSFMLGIMIYKNIRFRISIIKFLRLGGRTSASLKLAISIIFMLLFSLLAKVATLHEIVGAFIAGMIFRSLLPEEVEKELLDFTFAFFALLFFAYIGIETDLKSITIISDMVILIITFAFVGKILGGYIGARISGLTSRESITVGIAMNGRAAVELSIARTFYILGIFTREIFSAIILMSVITSLATPIMLKVFIKGALRR